MKARKTKNHAMPIHNNCNNTISPCTISVNPYHPNNITSKKIHVDTGTSVISATSFPNISNKYNENAKSRFNACFGFFGFLTNTSRMDENTICCNVTVPLPLLFRL